MITIVDYGMGNVGSIANMLKRLGFEARLGASPSEIAEADKLILPGVGSFDAGMANLEGLGVRRALEDAMRSGIPVLGICLGMQLLFEGSEEGTRPGLGVLRGRCVRFQFEECRGLLRVPHMGWNDVRPVRCDSLFRDMSEDARYYFVHSYHARCDDESDVLSWTMYGYEFPSAVQRGNISGTQFHPEKSHKHGSRILKRFAES